MNLTKRNYWTKSFPVSRACKYIKLFYLPRLQNTLPHDPMSNATENANELGGLLQLEYNKARQQTITNDMLDIVGGAAAQTN
jgi:hypothetical protein